MKTSDGFSADGREVASDHIERLLETVTSPVIAELSLVNLGITPEWVEANAPAILEGIAAAKYGKFLGNCSERQKGFFRDQVHRPSTIEKAVEDYYLGLVWTDDYPEITVEISFTAPFNGRRAPESAASRTIKIAQLDKFGYCGEFLAPHSYPWNGPSHFERLLKKIREDVCFVEEFSYLELMEIAKTRLRGR